MSDSSNSQSGGEATFQLDKYLQLDVQYQKM
jgi:hypothetical protein